MATQLSYDANAALKAARGFHAAARQLEAAGKQLFTRIRGGEGVRPDPHPPGTVGTPLEEDMLAQVLGAAAGEVVLEALALELLLKVRLTRAGIAVWATHNHSKLFGKLPALERTAAEQLYQARRHTSMRNTLNEVLAFSADQFVKWRYLYEEPSVTAANSEMQLAFEVLVNGP